MNDWIKFFLPCFLALFTFGITACGGDNNEREDENALNLSGKGKLRARNGNLARSGSVQDQDINEDGVADQWTLSQGGEKRIERDLNFDGSVDMWQYPDSAGQIVEEEMDLDLDGNVDLVVFYKDGTITRKELSTDFSGLFTIVKYYDGKGALLRVERDDDADGDIDIWEYYENNQRIRVAWDNDDDGTPDEFDSSN